ncbi:phage holin family protein [Cellulosimicrobium terreum]|nr:phage holin family protein [Cellulosimicrobium terreum]
MVRLIIRLLILLASAALGLLVASWIIDGVEVTASGFIIVIVVFTIAQAILSPFIAKTAARYAPAFLGGIGLVSTFVALLVASLIGDGLVISGVVSWILATLVVWLVTALATFLLPMFFLKEKAEERRKGDGAGPAARAVGG